MNPGPKRPWLAGLGVVLAVGFALRVFGLANNPPGLWYDEALNGIDAWNVWQPGGGFKLIYPDVFPREPMFETLLAFAVRIAGPEALALRAVPVFIGTLTILLLYLMLRKEAGEPTALVAAGVLATMRWHALFSRLVFRTLILPLWLILIVWAALAFRRKPTLARAALLGALIGGGFYTYLAWYFMLPLVAGILIWVHWKKPLRHLGLTLAMAAIVFAPLGIHYLQNPDHLLARPGAVSVFNEGFEAGLHEIGENALDALLMFHWKGDHVEVQNVPWMPALDWVQGFFFFWGIVVCLRRRDGLSFVLLGWIACGMATTIFTYTDSPNFLRSLAMTPAVASVVAMGMIDAGGRLKNRRTGGWLIAGMLLVSAGWTGWQLHGWARREDVWRKYQWPVVQMGKEARQRAEEGRMIFIPAPVFEQALPFKFQVLGAAGIAPYENLEFVRTAPAGSIVFFMAGMNIEPAARGLRPETRLVSRILSPEGRFVAGALDLGAP